MNVQSDDFKFPDEVAVTSEADTEVEVEIVDDTPEKDRGRKPLDREVTDPTDEEIESYSDKVQSRIKELTHARHDERRQKEAVAREKAELERLAQHLINENNALKRNVNQGQEVIISSARKEAETKLDAARRRLKEAQEAFDTDGIVAAQEALAEATWEVQEAKKFRAQPLQETQYQVQPQPSPQTQVQPDEKSLRWQAKNQWFGQPGFEEYTSYALGLHQKLVNGGIDPRSDDYFDQIDGRMKNQFPEIFGGNVKSGDTQKRPTTVVASAARTTSGGKIRLTQTQVALAKKYGLTPQQYAMEVAKLERQNG
jgi:hypothetical protein